MPLTLAHVSDLHVSTFGDTFHDRARIVKRSARLADTSASRFEEVWSEAGWRVLRERDARRTRLALIDPDGYAHPLARTSDSDLAALIAAAADKARRLDARRARTLAAADPWSAALARLADFTPKNSNVRLLRAARVVVASAVDMVAITGDLTDDGDGYELVLSAFASHRAANGLVAVPGNHDRYLFPLAGSGRPRATAASKRVAWLAFARQLGLDVHASGAWWREIPSAGVMIVGLDTSARAQLRFFRHNGAIGSEQFNRLRELARSPEWQRSRHRVVMLHHHVVPLAHGVGRRTPSELGMRLDDAKDAATVFNEIGVTLVMHGHRHVSEERQPAGCKFRLLASPSLTLGCRSGDGPSFWRVELGEHVHAARVLVPLERVDEDAVPGASVLGLPSAPSSAELPEDDGD